MFHNNTTNCATSTLRTTTKTATQDDDKLGWLSVVQLFLMFCILCVGTISNLLVLSVLTKRKNRRKASNILLLNLAVCDTLVSAVCISFDVIELISRRWVFGKHLCSVIYPFQTSMPVVSSYTMTFMLFERNLLFSRRIRSALRAKSVKYLACATWLVPLTIVLPYALHLEADVVSGEVSCIEKWSQASHRKMYTVALSVVEYLVPMICIVFLMVKIYGYLQHERAIVKNGTLGLERKVSIGRIKRNKRLTTIFIVMVCTYAILKLPNNAFWQWVEFGSGDTTSKHASIIRVFVGLCAYSTCMTNPFLFLSMSTEIRKDVRDLIARKIFCRKENSSFSDRYNHELTTLRTKSFAMQE
eukprot:gene16307-17947_t